MKRESKKRKIVNIKRREERKFTVNWYENGKGRGKRKLVILLKGFGFCHIFPSEEIKDSMKRNIQRIAEDQRREITDNLSNQLPWNLYGFSEYQ